MRYEYIFFDLDGTLTDSAPGITGGAMYALSKFGIETKERSELFKFVGPPLWDSFKMFYGFSEEQTAKAVEYYREYYLDKGIYENSVYDGVHELLERLITAGMKPVVATSKPISSAKIVLEHFDLLKYFDFVAGDNMEGTRSAKAAVIAYALENCGITDLSKVIMIGDREHDIIGAKKTGLASMGVLYGYGNREEFEKAGADYIAATVEEIGDILERAV